MKAHKKLMIAISLFTVLGAANSAIAGYIKYTPITDVTITSLVDYDVVFAGGRDSVPPELRRRRRSK
ncbi:MAG: hypothetical protein ACYTEX_09275 [Planctomycetota bacterium]|jgi:hypothetical protein